MMTVENWIILAMSIWCGVTAKDGLDVAVTALILATYFLK